MQTKQGSMLQSLGAVQAFLDQNVDPLAAVGTTRARQRLDDAIKALSTDASDETPATSGRRAPSGSNAPCAIHASGPHGADLADRSRASAGDSGSRAAPDAARQADHRTDAMLSGLNDRTQNRGRRGGATQGIKQKLAGGRRIVHVLDAFVKSALKDNRSLLTNWNVVKRVQKVAGRTALPVVPPAPTPVPVRRNAPYKEGRSRTLSVSPACMKQPST